MTPEQLDKELRKLRKTLCCINNTINNIEDSISNDPLAIKFAAPGGDEVAAENREFDISNFDLDFVADGGNSSLSFHAANATQRVITAQVLSPDGDSFAYVEPRVSDGNNFSLDVYAENSLGDWGELFITNNSLYLAHTEEVQLQTGSGDIRIDLIEGTGIEVEVQAGQTIEVQGVVQDDTATQLVALDAGNNLVYVDKATLIPTGASMITANTSGDNVPLDGSAIQILPIPITGEDYIMEYFVPLVQGSGRGFTFSLLFPGGISGFTVAVEVVAPSGDEIDTANIFRRTYQNSGTVTIPSSVFNSPSGNATMKITGTLLGNDTPGNVELQISLDSAGPQVGIIGSSWARFTSL